jgi:hypothetical protein
MILLTTNALVSQRVRSLDSRTALGRGVAICLGQAQRWCQADRVTIVKKLQKLTHQHLLHAFSSGCDYNLAF